MEVKEEMEEDEDDDEAEQPGTNILLTASYQIQGTVIRADQVIM